MIDPLYRLHAHRAMSDVPYEAFMISALGLGLYALQRLWSGRSAIATLLLVLLAGAASGLSILCKFNGLLGLIVIGCWVGSALIAPRLAVSRKLAMARRRAGDDGHRRDRFRHDESCTDGQAAGTSEPARLRSRTRI